MNQTQKSCPKIWFYKREFFYYCIKCKGYYLLENYNFKARMCNKCFNKKNENNQKNN